MPTTARPTGHEVEASTHSRGSLLRREAVHAIFGKVARSHETKAKAGGAERGMPSQQRIQGVQARTSP